MSLASMGILLAAATPSLNLGSDDIVKVDAHLEQRVVPRGVLRLHRGNSVFAQVTVRLREEPTGPLAIRIRPRPAGGVEVLPYGQPIALREGRRGRLTAETYVVLTAEPTAATSTVVTGAGLELVDSGNDLVVGQASVRFEVAVVPAAPTAAGIELDRLGYLRHQQLAAAAKALMPNLAKMVRLDDLELPPEGYPLTKEERQALTAFVRSRVRMDIARRRLRAAVDVADRTLARGALRAIASLAPEVKLNAPRSREPIADARSLLDSLRSDIDDLRLERAERTLMRLRLEPSLSRPLLARTLLLQGAIAAIRGDENKTLSLYGQALCLDPDIAPASSRFILREPFDALKSRGRCAKPLGVHSASAGRRDGAHGVEIVVRVLFGPDPFHVIERGRVQLLGQGGRAIASDEVVAQRGDLSTIEASFDAKSVPAEEGTITVRVIAVDMIGIPLATYEAPEAAPLVVAETVAPAVIGEGGGWPWWVWAVGGAVLASAATTAVLIATTGEERPGIGPIGVTF
ncbi:MAG: hypothetical protein IT384_30515 [Deltaproteobacteria bacterium]|nr:hypothetical protein [Deltaproteobacteria bacterium]